MQVNTCKWHVTQKQNDSFYSRFQAVTSGFRLAFVYTKLINIDDLLMQKELRILENIFETDVDSYPIERNYYLFMQNMVVICISETIKPCFQATHIVLSFFVNNPNTDPAVARDNLTIMTCY